MIEISGTLISFQFSKYRCCICLLYFERTSKFPNLGWDKYNFCCICVICLPEKTYILWANSFKPRKKFIHQKSLFGYVDMSVMRFILKLGPQVKQSLKSTIKGGVISSNCLIAQLKRILKMYPVDFDTHVLHKISVDVYFTIQG